VFNPDHSATRTRKGPAKGGAARPTSEADALRQAILDKLTYAVGREAGSARDHDWFVATALAVRDRIVDRWTASNRETDEGKRKRVYYMSLEFLIGRLLTDTLSNLGLIDVAREALAGLGVDFERVRAVEPDAALGNGGLGRLAACFMESTASLGIPTIGYGIRYDYGLFRQIIADGWQREVPEDWLSFGNPWEFERAEVVFPSGSGTISTGRSAGSGVPRRRSSRSPMTRRSSAGRARTSTGSGSGPPGPSIRSGSRRSTSATMWARSPTTPAPRRSPASSIPATPRPPARS